MKSLIVLLFLTTVSCVDISSHHTDSEALKQIFENMPKECTKNGKKYKEGEVFQLGRLRYKCQQYGVYSIEGCMTSKNRSLSIGESIEIEHVLHQCLGAGSAVYYRETTCGSMGQPDCDKVPKPTGFEEAVRKQKEGKASPLVQGQEITVEGLPPGWKVLETSRRTIPGTNATIVSKTLIFGGGSSRAKRQTGRGIPSVVRIEDVGTDKPQMPLHMLLGGKKISTSEHKPKQPALFTQHVSATMKTVSSGDMHDANIRDLNEHHEKKADPKLQAHSVSGSRSDVDWKGKTITVDGKKVGAGPGTFTFGNRPTGGQQ